MSENEGTIYGKSGWGGRGDNDIDRKPGNSTESRSYSRHFDPRSEQEFTNRMEVQNQIEQARLLKDLAAQEEAAREGAMRGARAVHFFPSVGKFIIPEENTWAAHRQLVEDDRNNLYFRPEKYVYFDQIIADRLRIPALTDERHPDYAKYEGLRTNLEVMRNDIIGMYLNDGGFDPGDEKYIPLISGIATELGNALAHDKWYARPFTRSIGMDVANVEGVGAREMYKHLLSVQEEAGPMYRVTHAFRTALGMPDRTWGLPPLDATPYSEHGLSAPPPAHGASCPPGEAQAVSREAAEQMAALSIHAVTEAHKLRSIDTLTPPTREESVEEARKILRWLKNLQFSDKDMEEWMGHGTPAEQLAKTQAVARLVEIYQAELHRGTQRTPALASELAIQDANDAAGAMSQGLLEHSMGSLPADHPHLKELDSLLATLPESWEMRQTQSAERLLEKLESGIEYASGRQVSDFTPAARLLEKSGRIHAHALALRSLDSLPTPEREESVELAREILRKLKNLSFSNKDIKEVIDTGRPEDKAELAEKIDEAVEAYRGLVAEAAQINPAILDDKAVKEGNAAAGAFSHTVKLMAAKEIPNSVAAAQQISADVTQMPEEWKKLDGRTVDRLVTSMEGGLERAVADITMDQQEQQNQDKDQEAAAAAAEAALHSEFAKRKRRRRRRSSSGHNMASSKGASKRRNAHDINGDGVLDKFQGLNQNAIRLNDNDLAAVRQLGGNLRNLGEQAGNLPPAAGVLDPAVIQQVTQQQPGEEKPFVQRERDQKQKNKSQKSQPGQRNKDMGI